MPCPTGMKSVILQGLLWLYLLEFGVIVESLEPGYLDFDNLPDTNFSCVGKVIGGYYADLETSCQMFHVCTIGQLDEPMDIRFLCLNGTVFDQETRVCERIDEVDCSKSEKFYHLNLELYGNTQPPILEESPETDPPSPQVKNTTTTTTSTTKPSFYTTSRPVTTSRSKTISSHHFPVDSSPDIRFNPEEINISLNPESPPTIRTKPISFQQQSFSEDRNKHIIVTHTSGFAAEHKQPGTKIPVHTAKISITTGQPKVSYGVSQSPTPTEINGEFGYQNTEAILDYDTELPPHNYQYHASVPHFQPTAAEIHPYSELYKSSTYRTLYHTTASPLKLYHSRATTSRIQNIPKPPPYHYQRTEKATRLPQPLPLYSTLRPLTFSSPAPFSAKRHIDSKRNTDHQVPRIIISSSASGTVVDPTGRILNYSIGDTHMLGRKPPASYDDYKEDDISLDPFYRDVPKLISKEQEAKRQKRSAKQREPTLKNEEEETDALKFLLNWYSSYEQTTKIPIPLPSAAITEINNELSASTISDKNSTLDEYDDYEAVSSNTTNTDDEISDHKNQTTGDNQNPLDLNDFKLEEILEENSDNGTDGSNKNNDSEYDYTGEYDDYNNEALNATDKEAREKERNEQYVQYMKLNERISKIFSNDYVDYSGKPLAYLEAFAKSEVKETEDKTNYLSTESPADDTTESDDLKNKVMDDVIDNPLNVTKDNQTVVADDVTKVLDEDDYVDDNYEAEIYERSSKATTEKLTDDENLKTKTLEVNDDSVAETLSDGDNREGKNYISTTQTNTDFSLITSTENIQPANEDYVDDDYDDKNHPVATGLPPNEVFANVNSDNESKTSVDESVRENDQTYSSFGLITTESVISENLNEEVLDDASQAELVTTTRKISVITTTSRVPENLSHDNVEYNGNGDGEVTLAEETTTTTEKNKLAIDYFDEIIEPLLNTEPPKTEEGTTEKLQEITTGNPLTMPDVHPTLTTTRVDAKENVTPTEESKSSFEKPEAILHRTVTRGRTRFGQNSVKVNPITNLKSRINKGYGKFKSRYSTRKHDTAVSNGDLKESNVEQTTKQTVNFDQEALRKMAAQAFSLHKKQEATTENIESVISKAISKNKVRFGLNERKYVGVEEITTTSISPTQIFPDTTEFVEELFTKNAEFNDGTTTSALPTTTETYTSGSTMETTESYTTITTELPTTYLQKVIENIEATTKSVATSIILPATTIDLESISETESNYFAKNDALLTSTEISSTTQANNEEAVTTFKPIHTTGRRIGSRGRPFQYSRRTTTPRRSHTHRFDVQGRRRYDRRKPHSAEIESSTENKTVTDATSMNSNFNSVNIKSSAVPNDLNSPDQQETPTTDRVLHTSTIADKHNHVSAKTRKFSLNNLDKNTDRKEENVTDPSFSKSANPTLAKESKEELSTTPISRFIRIKVRKEKMHKSYVFNCFGKKIQQYYSDPRDCRLFHYCTPGFTKFQLLDMKFVCDLGTYFDDEKLTCTEEKPSRCR